MYLPATRNSKQINCIEIFIFVILYTLITITKFTQIINDLILIFNFIDAYNHESCKTIIRQNRTTALLITIENMSIYPSKIILSEMNNNLIINSKLIITDVIVIRKVFRYYACKISLTSNFKSVSVVHKVLNEIDLITSRRIYFLMNYELP